MPDEADAFEIFRAYLDKEVAPLLPIDKREQIVDGIIRAAYTFGGALLARGAGGSIAWLAFLKNNQLSEDDEDVEENEETPEGPSSNVLAFPSRPTNREESDETN